MNTDVNLLLWFIAFFLGTGIFGQWFLGARKKYLVNLARTHDIKLGGFREKRAKYDKALTLVTYFSVGGFFVTCAVATMSINLWWSVVISIVLTLLIAWLTNKPW